MRRVIVLLCAFGVGGAAMAQSAADATAPEMTTTVVRINNKRYKKVTSGSQTLYVPSVGLPVVTSIHESICPAALGKGDVLEIGKPVPADDEFKAAAKVILAAMQDCGKGKTAAGGESSDYDCVGLEPGVVQAPGGSVGASTNTGWDSKNGSHGGTEKSIKFGAGPVDCTKKTKK